jgi:hypothetical protein
MIFIPLLHGSQYQEYCWLRDSTLLGLTKENCCHGYIVTYLATITEITSAGSEPTESQQNSWGEDRIVLVDWGSLPASPGGPYKNFGIL